MTRSCRIERGGDSVAAGWELTTDTQQLFPAGRPSESWPLAEVRSVGRDGWSVRLVIGGSELVLSRLGTETDGLVSALRRMWPPLRATALRIAGDGAPLRFAGSVATPEHLEPTPAEILVWPEAVVIAPCGRDLAALPLAHVAEIAEDSEAWTVTARGWDGSAWTFSRLAGDTTRLMGAGRRPSGARRDRERGTGREPARPRPRVTGEPRRTLAPGPPPRAVGTRGVGAGVRESVRSELAAVTAAPGRSGNAARYLQHGRSPARLPGRPAEGGRRGAGVNELARHQRTGRSA